MNEHQDALGLNRYTLLPNIFAVRQSENLYAYCTGNPIGFVDVNGTFVVSTTVLVVAGLAALGAVIGGYIGNRIADSQGATGWEKAGYIAGGAVVGGVVGGAAGYVAAPAIASATGVAGISVSTAGISTVATAGTTGTLGNIVYSSWQQAEQSVREIICSVSKQSERILDTPFGRRIVDAYNPTTKVIAEAKYGYVSLNQFVEQQINKDAFLLQSGAIKHVEWHFFQSQITGLGGPSVPLMERLLKEGIEVIFH